MKVQDLDDVPESFIEREILSRRLRDELTTFAGLIRFIWEEKSTKEFMATVRIVSPHISIHGPLTRVRAIENFFVRHGDLQGRRFAYIRNFGNVTLLTQHRQPSISHPLGKMA